MRLEVKACPLCGGHGEPESTHVAPQRGDLPTAITWMRCGDCSHSYSLHQWTLAGIGRLLSTAYKEQVFGGDLDSQRWVWSKIVNRLLPFARKGRWVDVGTGNGALLFTAQEFGIEAVGLDIRPASLKALQDRGFAAIAADAAEYDYSGSGAVILADVLEHVPDPRGLLERIRGQTKAPVFVSCPNTETIIWKVRTERGDNPYLTEMEHYHNFSRDSLCRLLRECGFKPVHYSPSERYMSCMEVIAT